MVAAEEGTPNVLLVVFDSVRAANTSLHGHVHDTTPFLEGLAGESTVYTQARSPGTSSIPSHVSMFTGLHVREHGLTTRSDRLKSGHTIWERLADRFGYATAVFSNNPFLTEIPIGLSDAFETVVGRSSEYPAPSGVNPKNFVIDRTDGPRKYLEFLAAARRSDAPFGSLLNGVAFKFPDIADRVLPRRWRSDASAGFYADQFLEWVSDRNEPWAACLNFMDAHYPYEPNEWDRWGGDALKAIQDRIDDQAWEFVGGTRPWWERRALDARYDGAIRSMDATLERIVDQLRDRDALDNTLLIITADHGEAFGERSHLLDERLVGHGNGGLHECLLHVPLLVRAPGQSAGETIQTPVSLTRFEDVVSSVATDGGSPRFDDGAMVVSTTLGLDSGARERAQRYVDQETLDALSTPLDVIYEPGEGLVRGHCRSADGETERRSIPSAQTHWSTVPDPDSPVESVLSSFEPADIVTGETASVDDSVTRRLERLGYA